jgi:uncharacterized protein (DUF2336 family)
LSPRQKGGSGAAADYSCDEAAASGIVTSREFTNAYRLATNDVYPSASGCARGGPSRSGGYSREETMSQPARKNPIINEIEQAVRSGSPGKRIKILMSVTDLFVAGAPGYGENDTKLFDDVIGHLINEVESAVLVELSTRLAAIPNAPMGTIQSLARHGSIEVSGPVLKQSPRLSDKDLIEIVQTKSQAHMANVARRPRINEPVSDVLVENGNADVASIVADNAGALMSRLTMAKLVMRADGDDRLTEVVSRRADISPAIFRQLLLQATATVRAKLLASAKPEQQATINQILDEISAQAADTAPVERDFAQAQRIISMFSQDTDLTRMKVLEFADDHRVAEMIAGLAALSGVPTEQIDRLFQSSNPFGLMVLCKSSDLAWNATFAVIGARRDTQGPLDGLHEQFNELSVVSAQKLIHFWLGRQKVFRNFKQPPDSK